MKLCEREQAALYRVESGMELIGDDARIVAEAYRKLEAEGDALREIVTRGCYYRVLPEEGNYAIYGAVHLIKWNEHASQPDVLFDECSEEWLEARLVSHNTQEVE